MSTEWVLCAGHYVLLPHACQFITPSAKALLSCLLYRCGNWGAGKFSNLPKFMKPVRGFGHQATWSGHLEAMCQGHWSGSLFSLQGSWALDKVQRQTGSPSWPFCHCPPAPWHGCSKACAVCVFGGRVWAFPFITTCTGMSVANKTWHFGCYWTRDRFQKCSKGNSKKVFLYPAKCHTQNPWIETPLNWAPKPVEVIS